MYSLIHTYANSSPISDYKIFSVGPCMNGNNRVLGRQFNPYGDQGKVVVRKDGSSSDRRQYASSVGEHDYSEIDNFDINSGGKF